VKDDSSFIFRVKQFKDTFWSAAWIRTANHTILRNYSNCLPVDTSSSSRKL